MVVTIGGIVSVLVVVLSSLLKNVTWPAKAKFTLATALSVVGGIVTVVTTQGWDAFASADTATAVAGVFAASQVIYKLIIDGTSVEDTLANSGNTPKDV